VLDGVRRWCRVTAAAVAAASLSRRIAYLSCGGGCDDAECGPEDRRPGPPTVAPIPCHTSRRHGGPHTRARELVARARAFAIQRRCVVPRACAAVPYSSVRRTTDPSPPPSQRLTNNVVRTHAHVQLTTVVGYRTCISV